MKKKIVAVLLGAALTVSCLAACGNTQEQAETTASQEESAATEESGSEAESTESGEIADDAFAGTEISIAISKNDADMCEDFSEKPAAKMAEEITGIKVNWIAIDGATQSEKVSTMLASDMPDMLIGLVGSETVAKNMDLFYDLSEDNLLETYAPNVYADYQGINGAMEAITWKDGSIRSLMSNGAVNYNAQARGIMYINKNWLDKLGLDMPTNGDELYEVLCAFRDNDCNGNGDPSDEIPYGFCQNHYASMIYEFGSYFGIAGEGDGLLAFAKMVKDGKVVPTFDTDQMRACLTYLHNMVEDGLIDVEGFSQTNEQWSAKLADGKVGMFSGWTPATYMDKELAEQYTLLTPFSMMDGVDFVQSGKYQGLASFPCTVVFSADSENVKAALHYYNTLSSTTEMKYTAIYGQQGDVWDYDENGELYVKDYEGALPDGWTTTNYSYTYALMGGGLGPVRRDEEQPRTDWSEGGRPYYVKQVLDYVNKEYTPVRMADPDKLSERAFLETELEAYLSQFVATSVMEGITDKSWEAHLEQLNAYQYYDWIDWWQGFCDKEF